MVTIIQSNGTIVKTQPERIYQGSNKVNQIVLVGAYAQNLIPEIAFKLPQSGVYTKFDYMTSANVPTIEGVSAWTYDIPLAVTQEYGQVDFQIQVKDIDGRIVASGLCSFEVERGIPPDISSIPNIDPLETLKQIVQSIQGDIENNWFVSKGILPYDSAFTYPANAITYDDSNYTFYQSLENNNKGNSLTDTTNWKAISIATEESVNSKIAEHNTSSEAHQDIRNLIASLTSRVTKNENDITSNSSNIAQNTLSISNLTAIVDSNSSLITETRNNIANNYYSKTQTYTKDEVNSLLGTAAGFQFVIVDELPEVGDPTKIYLVPISQGSTQEVVENSYFEYIWLADESRYERIGSTQIDLSNYFTKEEITSLLAPINQSISDLQSADTTNKANITSLQTNKLDKNQGIGNAGKMLVIGLDGSITYVDIPEWTSVTVNGEAQKTFNADTKANVKDLSHPNLLINANFQVNQRGQSQYVSTGSGANQRIESVDKLQVYNGAIVDVLEKGIKVTLSRIYNGIRYIFDEKDFISLQGQTVTFSVNIFNATLNRGTRQLQIYINESQSASTFIHNAGIVTLTTTLPDMITALDVRVITYSNDTLVDEIYIDWWKLEIGSIATEFSPMPYDRDLIACQVDNPMTFATLDNSQTFTAEKRFTQNVIKTQINGFSGFKVYNSGYVAGTIFEGSNAIGLGTFTTYDIAGKEWFNSFQGYAYSNGRIATRLQARQATAEGATTYNTAELYLWAGLGDEGKWATLNCNFYPVNNNSYDLGTTTNRWRNLFLSDTAYVQSIMLDGTNLQTTLNSKAKQTDLDNVGQIIEIQKLNNEQNFVLAIPANARYIQFAATSNQASSVVFGKMIGVNELYSLLTSLGMATVEDTISMYLLDERDVVTRGLVSMVKQSTGSYVLNYTVSFQQGFVGGGEYLYAITMK